MQFLTNINIDFMRYRVPLAVVSAILATLSLIYVFQGKLNIGIDFAGGTQITVQFQEEPNLDELRDVVADAGYPESQLQRFGGDAANEVLIRTSTVEGSEEGSSKDLLEALDARYNADKGDRLDLNRVNAQLLLDRLIQADPLGLNPDVALGDEPEEYRQAVDALVGLRRQVGAIQDWQQISDLPAVGDEIFERFEQFGHLGSYALLAVENVGPQIGNELKSKGIWAVILALTGMLIYIAIRFEFRFGVGAVVAIVHDVTITLGAYSFFGYEFNLTTIAAFLTLVGYSVNDTVVVFDRVRENMLKAKKERFYNVLNRSINQTLSRTVMTSMTTLMVVACLFTFGGEVLEGFAFLLLFGVVIGTYSSVFVASPVVLVWEHYFGEKGQARRAAARREAAKNS